jgi:hypothetical protein
MMSITGTILSSPRYNHGMVRWRAIRLLPEGYRQHASAGYAKVSRSTFEQVFGVTHCPQPAHWFIFSFNRLSTFNQ